MNGTASRTIRVTTASAVYDAVVGSGTLGSLGMMLAASLAPRRAARAFLAWDRGLPAGTVRLARDSISDAGFAVADAPLLATEERKSLDAMEELLDAIAMSRLERFEPVVALGGGIVGDLAGFAAAAYRRGVPVVQCPTTLLSMVDASVGGKTGVNLRVGSMSSAAQDPGSMGASAPSLKKNLVGAFHQPALVLADVATLGSLSDRHLRAGLAECIKHGMISAGLGEGFDGALFTDTLASLDSVLRRDDAALIDLVARNIAVKAGVVGTDEREELPSHLGGRALLNLGHTFGHAIETIAGLSPDGDPANSPLHHGEAVALGLIAAAHCSLAAGLCRPAVVERVIEAVSRAGLPTRVRSLPPNDRLIELMSHDKKVTAGRIRLVLPIGHEVGVCAIVEDTSKKHIAAGWDSIRA